MDAGLDNLLDLHGTEVHREDGYWWKIDVWRVTPSKERPHGIRYNLTLHNKFNSRIFGKDNAHAVKPPKRKGFTGKRHDYDYIPISPQNARFSGSLKRFRQGGYLQT